LPVPAAGTSASNRPIRDPSVTNHAKLPGTIISMQDGLSAATF
jgi:hypothetical protein